MLYPQQNLFRNKLDLSGIWDFQIDSAQAGEKEGWYNGLSQPIPIAVPGSWNEQYADLYHYLGLAWYVRTTFIPQGWRGSRVFLRVGSACYSSTIYINGNKVGSHEGGHLPFAFEITEHLQWDIENRIAISVENELKPSRVPAGNMDSPLLAIATYPKTTYDFFPFAGIHRPVVLYSVPNTFINDITVVTGIEDANGIVEVTARLNQIIDQPGSITLKGDGYVENLLFHFQGGVAQTQFVVSNAKLWSDQNPFLYDLILSTGQDQYSLKIGIRTVAVESGKIFLNGKPVQLKGFGRHEDFFASGKGLNFPLLVKDYQLMRWTGANSFRTSHYPYSEEDMQLADSQGFLIIDEIPAVSLQFEDNDNIASRLKLCQQQIDDLIARDKNHPSVLIWCVANEPMTAVLGEAAKDDPSFHKGKHFLDSLCQRVRELDSTRLVTFSALHGSPQHWVEHCDIICLNRYWGWYVLGGELEKALSEFERELEELWEAFGKPILITEFGADTLAGMHGHPDLMWTEEYQADYIRRHLEIAARKEFIAGMQVWNFADFAAVQSIMRVGGLNMKGIFTRMRTPKLAAHVLKEFWFKSQE